MIIGDRATVHTPKGVSLSASVTWEEQAIAPQTVRFDIGAPIAGGDRGSANAFLAACFPLAAVYGEQRLRIEGYPCPMLMEGLRTAHAWWRGWGGMPDRAPVIETGPRIPGRALRAQSRGAMFLSGGVDSLHALLINHRLYHRDDPAYVRTAIVVHGFDIGKRPRDPEQTRFEMLLARLAPIAAETGVTLVPCRTNLRHLPSPLGFWGYRHNGAALAAVGHATIPGPSHILIASGNGVANDGPLGSHPTIDGLFSSQWLTVVHDGARFSRLDKVRDLARWPAALRALRVCSSQVGEQANCGRCEKCLRTRLELLAAGVEWTEAFGPSLTPAALWEVEPSLAIGDCSLLYADLLPILRERGLAALVHIIEGRIAAYRKRAHLGREWPAAAPTHATGCHRLHGEVAA
jgi:hypothetical protein